MQTNTQNVCDEQRISKVTRRQYATNRESAKSHAVTDEQRFSKVTRRQYVSNGESEKSHPVHDEQRTSKITRKYVTDREPANSHADII